MARRRSGGGISKKKVKWHLRAFADIRYLPPVEREVAKKVWQVRMPADAHGQGSYESGTEDGGDRVRGYVVTRDGAAIRAEAADHVLQRALAALKTGPQDPGPELVEYITLKGDVRRVSRAQAEAWKRSRSVHNERGV
jgi:hypothetical protein